MTELSITIKKIVQAPIERVFDAWLDAEMLARFILPMPGMPQPEVENEPHQGGGFTIVMHVGENKIPHTGEYLEISRPDRLVFSWVSPFSTDGSKVTINFSKSGNGGTDVELTHVRFIDEEARSNHEGGWTNILKKLDDIMVESVVM